MLPKSLLIAMFFAVCIDRSFEAPRIINTANDQETLNIVRQNGLANGMLPILVTMNKNKITDQNILKFFNEKVEGITILKVNVDSNWNNNVTAKYLHHTNHESPGYPFVVALNNNRLMRILVHGYDQGVLNSLFKQAMYPKSENAYAPNCKTFTEDLDEKIAQNDERNKKQNENDYKRKRERADHTDAKTRKKYSSSLMLTSYLIDKPTVDLEFHLGFSVWAADKSSNAQEAREKLSSKSPPLPGPEDK